MLNAQERIDGQFHQGARPRVTNMMLGATHGLGEGVRIATADIDQNAGFRLRPGAGYGGLQETLTGRCHGGR